MSDSTIFTGSSRFSADFTQLIDRSVKIASLPLLQMQQQLSILQSRQSAWDSMSAKFSSLESSVEALRAAMDGGRYSATVSDSSVAAVSAGNVLMASSIHLNIISTGNPTKSLSAPTIPAVSDPYTEGITSSQALSLRVAGVDYAITTSSSSLVALAQAINASDAPVHAAVLNLGTPLAPDFRLSIQSVELKDVSIGLNDGSSQLVETIFAGAPATYQLDGLPSQPIESTSAQVTLAPGLTANLLRAGEADITVGENVSPIKEHLAAFVEAFNAVMTELDTHRGKGGGALTADSMVRSLNDSLRQIAGFESSEGAVKGLAELGIEFDRNGRLSFATGTFDNAYSANPEAVGAFLGTPAGAGFLSSAGDVLEQVLDSEDGLITSTLDGLKTRIRSQENRVSDYETRIDALRLSLLERMAAADAIIASLEQQVTLYNGLFEAMLNNSRK